MKNLIFLFALLASANCHVLLPIHFGGGRIVGGENTHISEVPHQVSVRSYGSHLCGGSILNSRTIITAGHCVSNPSATKAYTVQYGVSEIGGVENIVAVERMVRHESYNSSGIDYDVALIFLSEEIEFGENSKPISLADTEAMADTDCTASGWGVTYEGGWQLAPVLQKVRVQVVDREECAEKYQPYQVTERMVCAGTPEGGKDSCQGDSGGPLVSLDGLLIGIVSWGVGCARAGYPGVYTNVFAVRDWIMDETNNGEC